ncbi:MAG: polysaccharide deacetylase family protein [Flavobacteriales bacterium]|nr:polysaccharide deacetylase family protein [Flavobacteriales bacterium]MCB9447543.1 polysaccharide deacetylase family protein [Flavobacteriales bacterium]
MLEKIRQGLRGEKRELPRQMCLLYHAFDPQPTHAFLNNHIHNVSPTQLHAQLSGLRKKGYAFVSVDEWLENTRTRARVCVVTIDDGYRSVIDHALPVFEDLQVHATLYLTTDLIKGNAFWRDQVRYVISHKRQQDFIDFVSLRSEKPVSLMPEGFYRQTKDPSVCNSRMIREWLREFLGQVNPQLNLDSDGLYLRAEDLKDTPWLSYGNHTVHHYVMASLTLEEQLFEVRTAEEDLKRMGVKVSRAFSIPFGNGGSYDPETIDLLIESGYQGCLLSAGHNPSAIHSNETGGIIGKNLIFVNRFMPHDHPEVVHRKA